MSDQSLVPTKAANLDNPDRRHQTEYQDPSNEMFELPNENLELELWKAIDEVEESSFPASKYGIETDTEIQPLFCRYAIPIVNPIFSPDTAKQRLCDEVDNLMASANHLNLGENSTTLDSGTVELAKRFIQELPLHADVPAIDLTLRGEIEFSWELASGDGLCVLVLPTGNLAISGIFGEIKLHGTVDWSEGALPDFVVSGLRWSRD